MREKVVSFRTPSPFGTATKRFAKLGFHPELDKSGAMKREITKLGPGSFNPARPGCKSKRGSNWQGKLELEEFSKYLGFRNAHVLAQRQFDRTLRGPGTNDINEELFRRQTSSQMENVGFGSGPRIAKKAGGQDTPPPSNSQHTYFKGINETFASSKKTFSHLPTFEFDGLVDRFKPTAQSYHLPPNLYELKDKKNVVDITKKVVSSRGPYELFTGPRDGSTIKNYFSPPEGGAPEYFYIKPSDLQHLTEHSSKKRYGLFLKGARFPTKPTVRHMLNDLSLCYRDPKDPGPAQYDLHNSSIQKFPPSRYPFDSSNVNARPPVDWRISPGPGRYNPKAPRCMKLKKPSWVFQSKADRTLFKVQNYSLISK